MEREYINIWGERSLYRRRELPKSAAQEAHEAQQEQRRQEQAARREENRKRWAEEDKEREAAQAAARAERQQRAEAEAKTSAQATFLAANANATEADFEKVWPRMREEQMVRRAQAAVDAEVEGLASQLGIVRTRSGGFSI